MSLVRTGWMALVLAAATLIFGSLTLLLALFDRHRRFTGWMSRGWAWTLLWTSGLDVTIKGRSNLVPDQKYIFMGNHTSALDIPLSFAALPGTVVFLAKKELFRIPFFGWCLRAAGMIPVNRQNRNEARKSVDHAVEKLKEWAISLMIYPEGTRSRNAQLRPFKRGGFLLAIRSGLPLVPVAVKGAYQAMPPETLRLTHSPIQVIIGQAIETQGLTDEDRDKLLHQVQTSLVSLLDGA